MKKELFNTLSMRFSAYYEVYRETNNLDWKEVNKEYILKTWKEICECEFVKNQSFVKFNPEEEDLDQMKFLINLISK